MIGLIPIIKYTKPIARAIHMAAITTLKHCCKKSTIRCFSVLNCFIDFDFNLNIKISNPQKIHYSEISVFK